MRQLLFELVLRSAERSPDTLGMSARGRSLSYGALAAAVERFAAGLIRLGLRGADRVAVYLPKQPETVLAMFGAARAGCVFVPVNPLLKPAQVAHILRDCAVRVLVTSPERAVGLGAVLQECPDLRALVSVGDGATGDALPARIAVVNW